MNINAKDLTKEPPTSPSERVGGYVILARMDDKCRAMIAGELGEYHSDCPLDHMLLDFKGVSFEEIKKELADGATDEDIAKYLDTHGTPKSPDEVKAWSDDMDKANPYENPDKRDWYAAECAKLDLDPQTTTLFEWLDAGDEAGY
jgi:hypothetical protein